MWVQLKRKLRNWGMFGGIKRRMAKGCIVAVFLKYLSPRSSVLNRGIIRNLK
jgi:hypothetical protein